MKWARKDLVTVTYSSRRNKLSISPRRLPTSPEAAPPRAALPRAPAVLRVVEDFLAERGAEKAGEARRATRTMEVKLACMLMSD